jgi:hypothetical protein
MRTLHRGLRVTDPARSEGHPDRMTEADFAERSTA